MKLFSEYKYYCQHCKTTLITSENQYIFLRQATRQMPPKTKFKKLAAKVQENH